MLVGDFDVVILESEVWPHKQQLDVVSHALQEMGP